MKKASVILFWAISQSFFLPSIKAQTAIANDDFDTISSIYYHYIDVLANDVVSDTNIKVRIDIWEINESLSVENNIIKYKIFQDSGEQVYTADTIQYYICTPYFPSDTLAQAKVYLKIDEKLFDGLSYNLDANNLKFSLFPLSPSNGNFFVSPYNKTRSEFPKGSGKTTVHSSGIWLSGRKGDINPWYVFSGNNYRGNYLWNGPISYKEHYLEPLNYYDYSNYIKNNEKFEKVWGITKADILYHIDNYFKKDYKMPWAIQNWPAHGDTTIGQAYYLAPFQDMNSDGIYTPEEGDFPHFYGDEAVYLIFNDSDHKTDYYNEYIGTTEVHCMYFSFNSSDNEAFNNTLFCRYQVFNRNLYGNSNIDSSYIGIWSDFDIGTSHDDYVGCNIEQGSFYAYNADTVDGDSTNFKSYGYLPPAQGVLMLKGPKLDDDQRDNNPFNPETGSDCGHGINGFGFGDGIIDNECMGMTNFMFYTNQIDPITSSQYYNYMTSKWKDGENLKYGGNGYNTQSPFDCRYAFPANTDPCFWGTNGIDPNYVAPNGSRQWTEINENTYYNDRRGVGSIGPFYFESNTVQELFIAYVFARSNNESDPFSINLLQARMDSIKEAFTMNIGPKGEKIYFDSLDVQLKQKPEVDKNTYFYPNPANDQLTFNFAAMEGEIKYSIYDINGKLLAKGITSDINPNISLKGYRNGLYFIKIQFNEKIITKKLVIY